MARRPTRCVETTPTAIARAFQVTDERYKTARAFGRYALIAFCVWMAERAIEALAGWETAVYVQTFLQVVADIKVWLAMTLAGLTSGWAIAERRLRQRAIVRLHSRVRELELNLDPARSSSNLTLDSKTNPEDREV